MHIDLCSMVSCQSEENKYSDFMALYMYGTGSRLLRYRGIVAKNGVYGLLRMNKLTSVS